MNRTIEFKGKILDLHDINKEVAHMLMDSIFERQEQGDKVNYGKWEKVVLTEEGEMLRITYNVHVGIDVRKYGD